MCKSRKLRGNGLDCLPRSKCREACLPSKTRLRYPRFPNQLTRQLVWLSTSRLFQWGRPKRTSLSSRSGCNCAGSSRKKRPEGSASRWQQYRLNFSWGTLILRTRTYHESQSFPLGFLWLRLSNTVRNNHNWNCRSSKRDSAAIAQP